MNNGKKTGVVSSGPVDREYTVNNTVSNLTTNEKTVNAQTLEKGLTDRVDREMHNIVDTVADRIQNKILAANDIIITPRIHFAITSINASSGRDTGSVTASSERGQHIGNTAPFENVSDRNNTFHELNAIDETRRNIPDKVGGFSVPRTFLIDNRTLTHHIKGSFFKKQNKFRLLFTISQLTFPLVV